MTPIFTFLWSVVILLSGGQDRSTPPTVDPFVQRCLPSNCRTHTTIRDKSQDSLWEFLLPDRSFEKEGEEEDRGDLKTCTITPFVPPVLSNGPMIDWVRGHFHLGNIALAEVRSTCLRC